jgi:hypothetical protein
LSTDRRLDRLYPALSAKERAILILRAWKAEEGHDPRIRSTIPTNQVHEYNRLIRLINGAHELGLVLIWLEAVLAQAELKQSWFMTLLLVAEDMEQIALWQLCETAEPITASAFQQRLAEGRKDLLSVNGAAELLVAEEGTPEEDAAYAGAVKEKRQQVQAAVAAGELGTRGKGSRMRMTAGDLYDWAGLEFKAVTEYGMSFDVHPDAEAEEVAAMRARRERMEQALRRWLGDDAEARERVQLVTALSGIGGEP